MLESRPIAASYLQAVGCGISIYSGHKRVEEGVSVERVYKVSAESSKDEVKVEPCRGYDGKGEANQRHSLGLGPIG